MARLLLLVPSATYRARDFLDAARALGVEVVVGTEEAHALQGVMGARSLEVPLDDPPGAARAIVDHDAVTPLDAVVAVDDVGTVVAAEASALLGPAPQPPRRRGRGTRQARSCGPAWLAAEVPQPAFAALPAGAGPTARWPRWSRRSGSPV